MHQLCSDMTPREVDLGPGGGVLALMSRPTHARKEGLAGALLAIDVDDGGSLESGAPALFLSGALSTDGGLLSLAIWTGIFRRSIPDGRAILVDSPAGTCPRLPHYL
ncbi:MAG: hypothetical protein CM15mP125_0100 [Gammaproteobacteria bacterium]|nr:MAG: hypothetical protein CM15mP125_0100 [Gammaproteobacteria bacterium]